MEESPDRTYTVLDLFAGAGGTGLGFKKAGFTIVGAVEIDEDAALTYEVNLGVPVTRRSIRDIDPAQFREQLGLRREELDVLVGCPPCQGFSRMRNERGASDERNGLVLNHLEFVREFMPRFTLFENVPGLLSSAHGRTFYEKLKSGLEELGYKSLSWTVDAANYGAAQHRRRAIVIAGRNGETPKFPTARYGRPGSVEVAAGLLSPWRTVKDEISQFPALEPGENGEQDGKYPNHVAPLTGRKVLHFIEKVPQNGGSRTDVPVSMWLPCHLEHKGHKDVYGRLGWDRPSNTITSGCTNVSRGRFVHPEQNRGLTYREAATLQGFPLSFVFKGKHIAMQIGNAVPVPLAHEIASTLKELLQQDAPDENAHSALRQGILHTSVAEEYTPVA